MSAMGYYHICALFRLPFLGNDELPHHRVLVLLLLLVP